MNEKDEPNEGAKQNPRSRTEEPKNKRLFAVVPRQDGAQEAGQRTPHPITASRARSLREHCDALEDLRRHSQPHPGVVLAIRVGTVVPQEDR